MHGNVCERVSGRRRRTLLFISFGCLKKEFSAGWISGGRVLLTKSGLNLMENKESHLMHAHLFLRPNIFFFKIKAGQFQSGTLSIAVFHQIQTTTTTKRVLQNDSLPFDAALADCVYRLAARLKMLSLAGFCWQFVGGEFFRFSFP